MVSLGVLPPLIVNGKETERDSGTNTSATPVPGIEPPPSTDSEVTGEGKSRHRESYLKPENWLELLCGDQILPSTMTLATIRQHIYKSSGDLPLTYRYKTP
ncbi:hypothetical protein BC938DRAFT_475084, partial [Jimgerdemannia flammicorona]